MLAEKVYSNSGFIEPQLMAKCFHTTIEEVSVFTGVSLSVLRKKDRVHSRKTQSKLQSVTEIINKVVAWTGSEQMAYAWYRSEPIPEFGGLTAQDVVLSGKTDKVRLYINHVVLGGFA